MKQVNADILDFRVDAFLDRMQGLERAANRIGAQFSVAVLEQEAYFKEWAFDPSYPLQKEYMRFVPIQIEYEDLRVEGWHIAAKIEHTEAGNIVKVLPDEAVSPTWREANPDCEHCGYNRRRNVTYILQHADGRFTQVGSTCLGDFLGHPDPDGYEAWFNMIHDIDRGQEDMDGFSYGGGHSYVDAKSILAATYYVARTEGWTSRTAARKSGYLVATADRVRDLLFPASREDKEERAEMARQADELKLAETAAEIINYAVETAEATPMLERSDYIHNLYTAIQGEYVDYKNFALVASAFAVWNRAQEEKQKEAGPEIIPGHFGEIKKRIEVRLQAIATYSYNTDWGTTYINKFRTEEGKIAVWKTGTEDFSGDAGTWFVGKATVKDHDGYRGEDQTLLTRCSLEAETEETTS